MDKVYYTGKYYGCHAETCCHNHHNTFTTDINGKAFNFDSRQQLIDRVGHDNIEHVDNDTYHHLKR